MALTILWHWNSEISLRV